MKTQCSQKKKKTVKNTNTWRLNSILPNNQWITEEIKEEIKKYLEANDNENMMTQNLRDTAKEVLRGKFITIRKARNISKKQPNFTPKATRERRRKKPS